MKIVKMDSFPPNSNPFNHDAMRMGVTIGTNVTVMMMNHETSRCDNLVIVNTETGERIKVVFDNEIDMADKFGHLLSAEE